MYRNFSQGGIFYAIRLTEVKTCSTNEGVNYRRNSRKSSDERACPWRIENGYSHLKVHTFLKLIDVLNQPFTFFIKENQCMEPIGSKIDELKKILQSDSLIQDPKYQGLLRALDNLEK